MTSEAIAAVLAWISIAGCVLMVGFLAATVYLLSLHLRLRKAGMAAEAAALAAPLPPEAALPHVVVQIPVFNEGALVRRGAEAAAALDWPRDRLHIQILDDSTDATPDISRAVAAELVARGIDAVVLHRDDRADFKAGALRAGMEQAPHDYFAIFDVDFVPPPDFLRRAMRVLLADEKLAFVQGRYDFLNPHENGLTEMQMVMQDAHLGIEQATRSWAGHPLPFNGTCGIWRRSAVEEAGGWRGESLAEDLDLSYRAWLKGRRGRFLVTVSAPGELPARLRSWATQQRRWTKGFGQVAHRMLPTIFVAPKLTLAARFAAVLHLAMWWSLPLSTLAFWLGIGAIVLDPGWFRSLGVALIALVALGYAASFAFLRIGNRFIRGDAMSLGRFVRAFLRVVGIAYIVDIVNTRAQIESLLGRQTGFVRTPKRGTTGQG
ncbi:MAG: glycosyltransferase [Rhodospirillaceae bacterium]|nr:glycosyltransferase [Rhodospirillaceae bacterium]